MVYRVFFAFRGNLLKLVPPLLSPLLPPQTDRPLIPFKQHPARNKTLPPTCAASNTGEVFSSPSSYESDSDAVYVREP